MSPFLARLSVLSFLAVATAITTNALYLQKTSLVSPTTASFPNNVTDGETEGFRVTDPIVTQSLPSGEQPSAALSSKEQNTVAKDDAPPVIAEPVSTDSIRAIQRELKSLGYEPGGIDGTPGLLTRAAILAFEHDKGFALTGEPTEELLVKILVRPDNKRRTKALPVSENGKKIIKVVQSVLSDLGYAPGKVNGLVSQQTVAAIKNFEKDRKLKITGRTSGQLMKELLSMTDIPLTDG